MTEVETELSTAKKIQFLQAPVATEFRQVTVVNTFKFFDSSVRVLASLNRTASVSAFFSLSLCIFSLWSLWNFYSVLIRLFFFSFCCCVLFARHVYLVIEWGFYRPCVSVSVRVSAVPPCRRACMPSRARRCVSVCARARVSQCVCDCAYLRVVCVCVLRVENVKLTPSWSFQAKGIGGLCACVCVWKTYRVISWSLIFCTVSLLFCKTV